MSITTVTFSSVSEAVQLRRAACKGTKRLASGAFATAYLKGGKKNPIVIKVGRMGDAYIEYAKKVIQAKSKNPFLPKLYSLTLYKASKAVKDDARWELEHREFYVVRMEHLYDLQDKHEHNVSRIVDMMEQLVEYNYSIDKWIKNNEYSSFSVPGVLEVKTTINRKALALLKDLRKIVMKARRVSDNGDWDIHDGNIMVRKNGQLVLTDPIA